jgi:hypothetical protein
MNKRSRSTLFLMEQLIVVAVFAVCAAACVKILTASFFMAEETRDINNAIKVAESSAESYKAAAGDIGTTARLMGGDAVSIGGADAVIMYYDEDWRACGEENAAYMLRLINGDSAPAQLAQGELSVEKLTGEVILAFPVAAVLGARG